MYNKVQTCSYKIVTYDAKLQHLILFSKISSLHWTAPPPPPRVVECAPDEQMVDVHTSATHTQLPVNEQSIHSKWYAFNSNVCSPLVSIPHAEFLALPAKTSWAVHRRPPSVAHALTALA